MFLLSLACCLCNYHLFVTYTISLSHYCAHSARDSLGSLSVWCGNCRRDKREASLPCGFCSALESCSCGRILCCRRGTPHPGLGDAQLGAATQGRRPTRQTYCLTPLFCPLLSPSTPYNNHWDHNSTPTTTEGKWYPNRKYNKTWKKVPLLLLPIHSHYHSVHTCTIH